MVTRDDFSLDSGVHVGDAVVLSLVTLDGLVQNLRAMGYETLGPTVRHGAVVPGAVDDVADLPTGVHDDQAPGRYRLTRGDDRQLFAWAVGPGSWKAHFFPASQQLWSAESSDGSIVFAEPTDPVPALAIIGARPCDVAALGVLDQVLRSGGHRDSFYADRRDKAFMVVAECASASGACFCSSMNTGPGIDDDFDVALTELDDANGHRFVARVGSARAVEALAGLALSAATEKDRAARQRVVAQATASMERHLATRGLAELLARNLEHPRWAEVAERCLSCGNCTLVCPTCFCSDVHDTSDLAGTVERRRGWSSCFDLSHSYLHGGPVRASTSSRYRQWMTHKLSTWWDQFDTSGCVGCGRCIVWCPVGIDITEEARAISESDGATRVNIQTGSRVP